MPIVPAGIEGNNWREIIEAHPFLRYERKSFGGRMVEKFIRDQQLVVQESIELDEIQGLFQMVANGLGVALIPMMQAHLPLPGNVRALPLGEHTFYREVGLLQVKAKAGQPVFGEPARCLREAAGSEKLLNFV